MSIEDNSFAVSTWNILGDRHHRQSRLVRVATELRNADICALQEVVFSDNGNSSAHEIAELSEFTIASLIPTGTNNFVSGDAQATAILTRLPIVTPNIAIRAPLIEEAKTGKEPKGYSGAILKSRTNRKIFIASIHLPWGGDQENRRLLHLQTICSQIDEIMNDLPKDSVAILAGDFNTTPASDSVRFLSGELAKEGCSAFWIDSWSAAGHGDGYTFDPKVKNLNLERTANETGLFKPEFMPRRRLDFIFVKGWAYGRQGSPLEASIIGEFPDQNGLHASDHYGIRTLFWDPD